MAALAAVVLVSAVWGLLWVGAAWAGVDSRDGRDWHDRGSVTAPQPRVRR